MWYAEHGSGAHTMKSLAGRVVPMWVPDPQGQLSAENPKAKTRVTVDGRRQVLIFRRAAKLGQRKRVVRRVGGAQTHVEVPASYPGAPGRIAARSSSGAILAGNTGVRWRHPGNRGQHFISRSISAVAEAAGAGHPPVLSALQNG